MLRIPLFVLALLGALLIAAGPAAAEDPPQESRFFEEYDKNTDGVVTEDEWAGSGEVFRLLDKDGDGKVSPKDLGLPADFRPDPNAKRKREMAERASRGRQRGGGNPDRAQRLRKLLERYDADKDGVVKQAEWRGDANLFERLDRNKDGQLDKMDYPGLFGAMEMDGERMDDPAGSKTDKPGAAVTPGGPEPNKPPRRPDAKPDKPRRGGRDLSPEQVNKRFQELDKDADQELTAADGVNARLIERMDADQSGGVSLAEFRAAVKQASGKRGSRGGQANGERIKKMLRRFDQDGDGKVSRDEFPGSDERFDGMDKNDDDFLSSADFAKPKPPADKPKDDDAPKGADK